MIADALRTQFQELIRQVIVRTVTGSYKSQNLVEEFTPLFEQVVLATVREQENMNGDNPNTAKTSDVPELRRDQPNRVESVLEVPPRIADAELLKIWRSVQGPHAALNGPLIRFAGLVQQFKAEGRAPEPPKERQLCRRCNGNGVIPIHHGTSVCPECNGDCWAVEARVPHEPPASKLLARIASYFGNGGAWNPEMMDPIKVRDLLFDIRDHLQATNPPLPDPSTLEGQNLGMVADLDLFHMGQEYERKRARSARVPHEPPAVTEPLRDWLIWDDQSECWWGPNRGGYWKSLAFAGLYTEAEAKAAEGFAQRYNRKERAVHISVHAEAIERLYSALKAQSSRPAPPLDKDVWRRFAAALLYAQQNDHSHVVIGVETASAIEATIRPAPPAAHAAPTE